jgi:hypothetical protein
VSGAARRARALLGGLAVAAALALACDRAGLPRLAALDGEPWLDAAAPSVPGAGGAPASTDARGAPASPDARGGAGTSGASAAAPSVAGAPASRAPASSDARSPEAAAATPPAGPRPGARAEPSPASDGLPRDATAWAAAGRVVALERNGVVEVRDVSGALVSVVPGARPTLSADGRFLLVRDAPAPGALASAGAVHDLATGKVYPIPGEVAGAPAWSPERDAIALALKVEGAVDLYLLRLPGHDATAEPRLHRLTQRGGAEPRWVGRRRLTYVAPRADGGYGLFIRDAGGLGPERPFWEEDRSAEPPPPRPTAQA